MEKSGQNYMAFNELNFLMFSSTQMQKLTISFPVQALRETPGNR